MEIVSLLQFEYNPVDGEIEIATLFHVEVEIQPCITKPTLKSNQPTILEMIEKPFVAEHINPFPGGVQLVRFLNF